MYFEIEDIKLELRIEGNKTIVYCTCKHCSTNPDSRHLCTFIITIILYQSKVLYEKDAKKYLRGLITPFPYFERKVKISDL